MTVTVGMTAPDFTLADQDGKKHRLSAYRGKWVLLYFYLKDLTPGCTVEACAIRDVWSEYKRRGIVVLGMSADSVASHRKFADKKKLPFTLLADEDKSVVKQYGVWGKKKFMGREYMGIKRMSFLIDPKGKIVKIYDSVAPAAHAAEVLSDVQSLSA